MAKNTRRDALLLTLGDPNGLGPELVCRSQAVRESAGPLLILGPEAALRLHAERLGLPRFWRRVDGPPEDALGSEGVWLYEPPGLADVRLEPGRPTPEGGLAAGVALDEAARLLIEGAAAGVVTAPLNKAMLQEAGFDFPGHTEFLADRAGLGHDEVCMHLCGPKLRVSLVTTHPPLKDVPGLITRERVLRMLRLTCEHAARLGLPEPVAVCGLNPHAGESGKIGSEEREIIAPTVAEARAMGLAAAGPFPADTIFHQAVAGRYSAVLAMYHDQGLGPLKLLHFGQAVNVTLGLPFVRTSVDHGTGYDLVGKDAADATSLEAALDMARRLLGRP